MAFGSPPSSSGILVPSRSQSSVRARILVRLVALLATLLVPGLPLTTSPAAEAAGTDPLRFEDPDNYTLASNAAPLAFLGLGEENAWWTALSDQASSGARFGLDKARFATQDPSLDLFFDELLTSAQYPDESPFDDHDAEIIGSVAGYVHDGSAGDDREIVVATVDTTGTVRIFGPQIDGYPTVDTVQLDDTDGFTFPAEDFRGMVLLGQDDRQVGSPTLIIGGPTTLYSITMKLGTDGELQVLPAIAGVVAGGTADFGNLLAIAHRPFWDLEYDQMAPPVSHTNDFYYAVEDETATDAERARPRIVRQNAVGVFEFVTGNNQGQNELKFDRGATDDGRNFELDYDYYETNPAAGSPNERVLLSWRGPSKPDTTTSRRAFLLRTNITAGGAIGASDWGNNDYACAGDMDFRAYQNVNTDGTGNFPTWTILCGDENGRRVGVTRATGTSLNVGLVVPGQLSLLDAGLEHNDPQVHLSYPCLELFRTTGVIQAGTFLGDQCPGVTFEIDDNGTPDDIDDDVRTVTNPGDVAVTVVSGVDGTGDVSRAAADDVVIEHALISTLVQNEWGLRSLPVTPDGDQQHTLVQLPFDEIKTVVDLDAAYDGCVLGAATECAPPQVTSEPIPLAILAAPPQVANANQTTFDPPIYATAQSTGGGTANSVGGSISVYGGINTGEKLVGGEIQVTAGYGFSFGSTTGGSIEVAQTQAFTGLEDDDSVVFQSKTSYQYEGVIKESTNGLVTGDDFLFAIPISVGRNVTSWGNLQALEPSTFGPGGVFFDAIEAVLDHEVGDPGSYPSFGGDTDPDAGQELDDRCLGSLDGLEEEFAALGRFDVASLNPFSASGNRLPSPEDAILTTESFQTIAGSLNGVGAEIEITRTDDSSYNIEHEIALAFEVLLGGGGVNAIIGGEASLALGTETTFSLGESTAFSASVGHFPSAELDEEVYGWRMYLCKQDLQAIGGLGLPFPVHVLGFTVDNYAGSGGIEDLAPIELLNGTGSQTISRTPTLEFEQPSGTVKNYEVQVEAIGADDRFSTSYGFDSTITGGTNAANTGSRTAQQSVDPLVDRPGEQLLPGQLYRWRVISTDFFGNVEQSDYEFFVTEGPPVANFSFAPANPVIDETVTFTAAEQPDATYAWDFGNGSTDTGSEVTTSFPDAGAQTVTLTVTNPQGSAVSSQVVRVGATPAEDRYTTDEDTELVVAAPGVLANDGGATTATLASDTGDGDLRLSSDGRFTYDPDTDVCGTDTFTYLASGNGVASPDPVRVDVDITCVNDRPVANGGDDVTTDEGVPVSVAAPGLLADDTDIDGDDLTAQLVDGSDDGAVVVAADGSWTFASTDEDFCGTTSFTYAAVDGALSSTPSVVVIAVTCADDPPTGPSQDPVQPATEDEPVDGTIPAEDPDGDTLTFELVDDADFGTVDLNTATGAYTYTPDPDACGTDRFVVRISDGTSSVLVPVTIEVACVDDPPPPFAGDDDDPTTTPVIPTDAGQPVTIDLTDDEGNPDGDETLTVVLLTVPATEVGVTTIQNGVLVYTPAPGVCGPVDVTYEVSDGTGPSVEQTVTIDVTCVLGAVESTSIRVLGGPVALDVAIDDSLAELTGRTTTRLAGEDRYDTAEAVVRDGWSAGSDTIFVTTGQNFPDSLAAGAAAGRVDAPVVLVDGRGGDVPTDLLADLDPARVVLVGGRSALSNDTALAIEEATGVKAVRIAGDDRYDTAAQLALAGWEDGAELVYVATGEDFPDALAGAAAAAERGAPVLLTRRDELPASTRAALVALGPDRVIVLGGDQAVDDEVVLAIEQELGTAPRRIAGQDRYETAALTVDDAWPDGAPTAFVATGRTFPDALAGAASAARRSSPVILTSPRVVPDFTRAVLARLL